MRKLYLFAIFLVIYQFTSYSANDMIMPGMLAVVSDFNAPISYVAASLSLYMLGECAVQLWLGPLAERYGKRQVILWGNLAFLIFTILIATSQTIQQFMLGRFLQGSGMALIAMGYALIHEKFNDQDAVKIIAIMGNVSIMAPLIGPLIGVIIIRYTSWHYVFIVTGILGLIALCGLYRYTPSSNNTRSIKKMTLLAIIKHYYLIIKSPLYVLGVLCTILGAMPLLIWIGLAPNLILHHLKLGYNDFILYQIIAIGGLAISSILVQFIAGRWRFNQLIQRGAYIALTGIIFAFIFHKQISYLSWSLFIYSLGLGLANGSIFRLIMSNNNVSQSMSASLMTFTQTLLFAIGIQLSDWFCANYDYSGFSFTLCCLISFGLAFILIITFANRVKNRELQ